MPFDQGMMLLCHGIGGSDLERITTLDTEYSIARHPALTRVRAARRYPLIVYGHTHERLVMHLDDIVLVNAGAVCHPDDSGFLILDFGSNHVEWHSMSAEGSRADRPVSLASRRRVACQKRTPQIVRALVRRRQETLKA